MMVCSPGRESRLTKICKSGKTCRIQFYSGHNREFSSISPCSGLGPGSCSRIPSVQGFLLQVQLIISSRRSFFRHQKGERSFWKTKERSVALI